MVVYLDLDGVLVNFNKVACKIVGAPYPPTKWHWYKDILDGFNRVNNACTVDFWKDLEWAPDGHGILRTVTYYINPQNIYLLTTPMPNLQSAWGKAEWVDKHLPDYNKRLIITRAPKELLARSGRLLIDDKDENINKFRNAGGHAILIYRPWNRGKDWLDFNFQNLEKNLEEILGKENE